MMGAQLQLELFARSTTPSPNAAPISPRSSAPATCSPGGSPGIPVAATATIPTAPAPDSSTRAGATSAPPPSSAATSTGESGVQPTLPIFTAPRHTPDPMLRIPRPATRAECLEEARPCPWASCRHHLLLEVAASKGGRDVRPTSLRLNRPHRGRGRATGRRSGLASSAAHHIVERWIDDAVEQLMGMRHTCALDVADEYLDGVTERSIGLVLGVSEKAAHADITRATERLRVKVRDLEPRAPRPRDPEAPAGPGVVRRSPGGAALALDR